MTSSLVGSEMCIRDRAHLARGTALHECGLQGAQAPCDLLESLGLGDVRCCLLYTSDAADDM
eukprot:8481852-Prorocentrum_lima.AAC.1